MKQVILDTSFVISCVKKKIDFFHDREVLGRDIFVPEQTMKELKGLGENLAIKLIEAHKFKLVKAPGKDADSAIIHIAKENPDAIVATLDMGLRKKLKNPILRIRGEKQLEIIN